KDLDHYPFPPANGAGAGNGEKTLRVKYLSLSLAVLAGIGLGRGRMAPAVTILAEDLFADVHLFFHSGIRLGEFDAHLIGQIVAPTGLSPASGPPAAAHPAQPKKILEDIPKRLENIL